MKAGTTIKKPRASAYALNNSSGRPATRCAVLKYIIYASSPTAMQHAVIPIYAGMSKNDFFTDSVILLPPVSKKRAYLWNQIVRTHWSDFYGSISSLIKLEIFQPFRSATEQWVSKANKIVQKARFRLRAVSIVRLAEACLKKLDRSIHGEFTKQTR